VFIDTAGLRRQSRVEDGIEFYSTLRSRRALERADICVLLIDASVGLHNQDLKIATLAWEAGRSLIVVVNKWDLVEKDDKTSAGLEKEWRAKAPFLRWVPFLFSSAKTGQRVHRILELLHARDLRDRASTRAWFFRILRRAVADHHAQSEVRASRLAALAAEIDEATPREVAVCACSLDRLGGIRRDYAEILRRVDIDEQSIAEAAATLGITVNNATVRLHRARRALREDLVAFCGTDSTRACMECSCNAE
jgi:small GTP-binding protein